MARAARLPTTAGALLILITMTEPSTIVSMSAIRPDMFQCMINTAKTHPRSTNMREIFNGLQDFCTAEMQIVSVVARSPGSLGQSIPTEHAEEWVIGSISLRLFIRPINAVFSVFVFPTGQLKISGGSAGFQATSDDPSAYVHWLDCSIIRPVLSIPVFSTFLGRLEKWEICLLNGTATLQCAQDCIDLATYKTMCHEMARHVSRATTNTDSHTITAFTNIRMPAFLSTSANHLPLKHTGRICSVTLRFKRNGSVRFDHKRSIQFMGFRNLTNMWQAMNELVKLLQACFPGANYSVLDTPPARKARATHRMLRQLRTIRPHALQESPPLPPLPPLSKNANCPCPMNLTESDNST